MTTTLATEISDPAYCECRATARLHEASGSMSLYFPKNLLDMGAGHRHSWSQWRTTSPRHAHTPLTRRDKRNDR